jgi:hypothetical protein
MHKIFCIFDVTNEGSEADGNASSHILKQKFGSKKKPWNNAEGKNEISLRCNWN